MEPEWGIAGGPSPGRWAPNLDDRPDERIELPRQPPFYSSNPSSPKSQRQVTSRQPVGRRVGRTVSRFLIAVFIGVGATLSWQSYGDAARRAIAARAPALAVLLPVPAATSPTSADPDQQLGMVASSLDGIRRSVEQLAAKQDQMVQNIALLRAVEDDIREKVSSAAPSPLEPSAPVPQPRPQQPRTQPSVSRIPSAVVPLQR
jgi:hypothetical protein